MPFSCFCPNLIQYIGIKKKVQIRLTKVCNKELSWNCFMNEMMYYSLLLLLRNCIVQSNRKSAPEIFLEALICAEKQVGWATVYLLRILAADLPKIKRELYLAGLYLVWLSCSMSYMHFGWVQFCFNKSFNISKKT